MTKKLYAIISLIIIAIIIAIVVVNYSINSNVDKKIAQSINQINRTQAIHISYKKIHASLYDVLLGRAEIDDIVLTFKGQSKPITIPVQKAVLSNFHQQDKVSFALQGIELGPILHHQALNNHDKAISPRFHQFSQRMIDFANPSININGTYHFKTKEMNYHYSVNAFNHKNVQTGRVVVKLNTNNKVHNLKQILNNSQVIRANSQDNLSFNITPAQLAQILGIKQQEISKVFRNFNLKTLQGHFDSVSSMTEKTRISTSNINIKGLGRIHLDEEILLTQPQTLKEVLLLPLNQQKTMFKDHLLKSLTLKYQDQGLTRALLINISKKMKQPLVKVKQLITLMTNDIFAGQSLTKGPMIAHAIEVYINNPKSMTISFTPKKPVAVSTFMTELKQYQQQQRQLSQHFNKKNLPMAQKIAMMKQQKQQSNRFLNLVFNQFNLTMQAT